MADSLPEALKEENMGYNHYITVIFIRKAKGGLNAFNPQGTK